MGLYLIGYEGRGSRPYDRLQEAIDKADGAHVIDNLWIVESDKDACALRDWIHQLMNDDDAIFVMQVKSGQHWASRHLKSSVNDWLKARV